MQDIIRKHLADLAAGDWAGYRAGLAGNAVYKELATGASVQSADEYVKIAQRWRKAFPDLTGHILESFDNENRCVVEVRWEATHTGVLESSFGTFAATRKRVSVEAAMVFTLEGGKIAKVHHYFDLMKLMVQLGISTGLPIAAAPKGAPAGAAPRH